MKRSHAEGMDSWLVSTNVTWASSGSCGILICKIFLLRKCQSGGGLSLLAQPGSGLFTVVKINAKLINHCLNF